MVRTQLQLTEAQAALLQSLARRQGTSMAALVRRAIDDLTARLGAEEEGSVRARALAAVGRYGSGQTDIAEHHDAHLAEAFRQ